MGAGDTTPVSMKTIATKNPRLQRLFATQVIHPQANPRTPLRTEPIGEPTGHDFLMLSARPDLTPEISATVIQPQRLAGSSRCL